MGSCVTALIASLAGMKDAKRAALIHFLFNLVGSAVVFLLLMIVRTPIVDLIMNLSSVLALLKLIYNFLLLVLNLLYRTFQEFF